MLASLRYSKNPHGEICGGRNNNKTAKEPTKTKSATSFALMAPRELPANIAEKIYRAPCNFKQLATPERIPNKAIDQFRLHRLDTNIANATKNSKRESALLLMIMKPNGNTKHK